MVCGGLGVSPACVASAACRCGLITLAIAVPWRTAEPSCILYTPSSPTTCYTGLQLQQLMSCYEGRVFVTINELHGTQCLRACLQPQCPHNPQSLCLHHQAICTRHSS